MGEGPARLLVDRYDVELFESTAAPPVADAIVIVKVLPSMSFLTRVKAAESLLLFVPVDGLQDPKHISRARRKLRLFDEMWLHLLAPYCAELHGIDHWNRYGLDSLPKYRDEGPLLWVGACENLPWLLAWLEEHPMPHPVRLLTNLDNGESRAAAQENAAAIGMTLESEPGMRTIGDHECAIWNEDIQRERMQAAKAGLDIKGPTLLQRHEPPTKAQQFIASGIPFAADPDAYAVE